MCTPLDPDALAALPLKERTTAVLDAINGTGVPNAAEVPAPADPTLTAAVEGWRERLGTTPALAAVVALLERASDPAEMTRSIPAALRDPTAPGPDEPFLARAV